MEFIDDAIRQFEMETFDIETIKGIAVCLGGKPDVASNLFLMYGGAIAASYLIALQIKQQRKEFSSIRNQY